MRKIFAGFALAAAISIVPAAFAEHLVILHTNDTHSHIDPDAKGNGGVLQRKAVIDSVRAAQPNVLLIDAGDVLQGSLYFMIFGGEVEQKMVNALGYDLAILGNHEFDNGMERLADYCKGLDAEMLSSNYDFSSTPLDGLFLPYTVKEYGGKRLAFIAINVRPDGLIDGKNYEGMKYSDGIKTANKLARLLKEKDKADMVIALTHIGYEDGSSGDGLSDRSLAAASTDIDLIIGGHSHTLVKPGTADSWALNANGDTVLIAQTGKYGNNIGEIDIDLETLKPQYKLIPINARLNDRIDSDLAAVIDSYRTKVDSLASVKIGRSAMAMPSDSPMLLNFASDVVLEEGGKLYGKPVDFAVMNKGGLRASLPKGDVTRGDIMNIFPFDNRLVVLQLPGSEVRKLLDILSGQGGNGVSKGVDVTMDTAASKATAVTINGEPLDDNRIYTIATIDYLAKGNDYMTPFKNGKILAASEVPILNEFISHIKALDAKGVKIKADNKRRMH